MLNVSILPQTTSQSMERVQVAAGVCTWIPHSEDSLRPPDQRRQILGCSKSGQKGVGESVKLMITSWERG